ncbi:MAG: PQQ-like beta-propeller repeat protein [Polyangiaceae bacterium]|nr:PQQ-like beta-propeller repeat protein [Polyangiaceae bacterium]
MTTARKNTKVSPRAEIPVVEAPLRWKLIPPNKVRFRSLLQLVEGHLWLVDTRHVVYRVSLEGEVVQSWQLPVPIVELLVDGDKVHPRDDTGMLFDLSGKQPLPFQQHGQLSPLPRLLLHQGKQVVLGKKGVVSAYNLKGKELWSVTVAGATRCWLFCADDDGIYLDAGGSVHALDWKGKPRWTTEVSKKALRYSWQSRHHLYVSSPHEGIFVLDKSGELVAHSPSGKNVGSATTSEDEARFFTTGRGRVVSWSGTGERLWEIRYTSDLTHETCTSGDRVYIAGFRCGLAGIDISSKARSEAAQEKLPDLVTRKVEALTAAPATATPSPARASKAPARATAKPPLKAARQGAPGKPQTPASAAAVTIECFLEGKEIRARVVSKGYHGDWACQFPRALRIAGARYQVDGVVESKTGDFYRIVGGVRRLT